MVFGWQMQNWTEPNIYTWHINYTLIFLIHKQKYPYFKFHPYLHCPIRLVLHHPFSQPRASHCLKLTLTGQWPPLKTTPFASFTHYNPDKFSFLNSYYYCHCEIVASSPLSLHDCYCRPSFATSDLWFLNLTKVWAYFQFSLWFAGYSHRSYAFFSFIQWIFEPIQYEKGAYVVRSDESNNQSETL